MTDAEGANPPVTPNSGMIATFARILFGCSEGWVAIRAFPEKGDASRPARMPFVAADAELAAKLQAEAQSAATRGLALYAVVGVVSGPGKAKAGDVIAIETILVDLDHGDVSTKRAHLTTHLGPPSLEVASGGVTADGQERLHLYWKLNEPVTGHDIGKVCHLRGLIAEKVGGDPSFRSAHQPIRVAGSVYRKGGVERLVTIRTEREAEYDLTEFSERVTVMPSLIGEARADELQYGVTKGSVIDLFAHQVRQGGLDGVTRFQALSRIIGYWIRRFRDGHVTREQAWEEIVAYNAARIVPPWPLDRLRQEAHRLWQHDSERHSGIGRDGRNSTGGGEETYLPESTEDALAIEFTRRYASDWIYVAAWGQWLTWAGGRWERENTLRAFDLTRLICREAAQRYEKPTLKARLGSAATVAAVERLARADRRHSASSDRWDRDPWLLNTPGGVVDLRTGRIMDHDRSFGMTKIATATPGKDCPIWCEFLATITNNDADLQAYLRRVIGYCLTGVTREHALFFLYGTGVNGKSVFVNTMSTILGDYAITAPIDMFMAVTGERHPTDMAGLRGARLVAAVETEQGRRWAESKLKALTGGDKVTARFMRQDFFEFVPQFKLVIAGNHKPAIRNIDEAMRRRFHMIPFTVTIPAAKRDKTLTDRLLAERDGILDWAVAGCLEWQRDGLSPPQSVLAATAEYFDDEDTVGRWIAESCDQRSSGTERVSTLFNAWKAWAEAAGEHIGSIRSFSQSLATRGFPKWRDPVTTQRGYRGIALKRGSQSPEDMEM